jgi:hypothetical protein
MADHDPLCPGPSLYMTLCQCALIARVRAEERERVASRYPFFRDFLEAEVRERIAQEIEAEWGHFMRVTSTDEHHWLGRVYADAARIARGTR